MPMRTVRIDPLTATGVDLSAVANGRTKVPVSGEFFGVRVQQGGTPNATLTFTDDDGQTLLTLAANTQADKWYYPMKLLQLTDGTDLTAVYGKQAVDGFIYVALSAGHTGQTLICTFKVLERGQ